jgi:hypothetical protein
MEGKLVALRVISNLNFWQENSRYNYKSPDDIEMKEDM